MQAQQAPMIFTEAERQAGDRLLKLALETDRVEGYTEPHAVMIARLAEAIGKELGLHGIDLSALKFAALAHDIGERGMKRNYLLSPHALTWEERLDLWRHPILGEQAAAELKLSRQTQLLVRWHQEWWNGQGYPDGLSGEAIPLGARILRAVDSYCALISGRPYRQAYELVEAEQHIADMAGVEFDPMVAKLLLMLVAEERRQREAELEFQQQQAAVWNVPPAFESGTDESYTGEEFQEVLPAEAVAEPYLPEESVDEPNVILTNSTYEAAAYESVLSFAETQPDHGNDHPAQEEHSSETPAVETIPPDPMPTLEIPVVELPKSPNHQTEQIQAEQIQESEAEPKEHTKPAEPAPDTQN